MQGRERVRNIQAEQEAIDKEETAEVQWRDAAEVERQLDEQRKAAALADLERRIAETKKALKLHKQLLKEEERRLVSEERDMMEAGEKAAKQTRKELSSFVLMDFISKPRAKVKLRQLKEHMHSSTLSATELHVAAKKKLMDDARLEAMLVALSKYRRLNPPFLPDEVMQGNDGISVQSVSTGSVISKEVALGIGSVKENSAIKKTRMHSNLKKLKKQLAELQREASADDDEEEDAEDEEEEESEEELQDRMARKIQSSWRWRKLRFGIKEMLKTMRTDVEDLV